MLPASRASMNSYIYFLAISVAEASIFEKSDGTTIAKISPIYDVECRFKSLPFYISSKSSSHLCQSIPFWEKQDIDLECSPFGQKVLDHHPK